MLQAEAVAERISPISGKVYNPVIQSDYSSEAALANMLSNYQVEVVICTFTIHYQSAIDAQVRLIRAADQTPCVKRFLPSEFNVDYDLGDDKLPYPDKHLHRQARRALEATETLEYAYIYPGMFMDYFGIPHVPTHLRELCFFVDPSNGVAALPGDGSAKMATSFTTDVARYTALSLELERWPRALITAASTVTLNELVGLAEENLGRKIKVSHHDDEVYKRHENVLLPRNKTLARDFPERFPDGKEQVRALIADLEVSVGLGAFDFEGIKDSVNLVKEFEGRVVPRRIEDVMEEAWKGR
jgi:hypothetical protein